jgi:methylmalonyl-CoA mutase, N-terminal domain
VLARRRTTRDQGAVDAALACLLEVARGTDNLIPAMLDATRVEATLGEICGVLKEEWGSYAEPPRF